MRENLLGYYNRELSYLRYLGADFAAKHPKVASRLRLEPDHCDDPHVERLLEAFAFLAARIHLRLDDEFPEITAALIEELYPNFMRPVPSVSLVEFQLDPERGKTTLGRRIPRGTPIHSRPAGGFVCRFRTCFETELWPIDVESAGWKPASAAPSEFAGRPTAAVLEVRLACMPDVAFSGLDLKRLRFFLNGGSDVVYPLYELLLSRCHSVLVQIPGAAKTLKLEPGCLRPAGFDTAETLCWDARQRRNFAGYQILEDYFSFPEKFLFLDLHGLEKLRDFSGARQASVLFLISPFERGEWKPVLEQGLSARTFRLNCTPIVNLFPVISDPIPVKSSAYELPVSTAPRMEIYSVDSVSGQASFSAERRRYGRYIDCGNEVESDEVAGYWDAVRRPSRLEEDMSEVFLRLIDRKGVPVDPRADTLTARLTCTNRDWPFRLPMGNPKGDFQMEEYAEVQKIVCLRRPSAGSPAPSAKTSFWRLVSQLALNHLSLVDEGRNALQCILRVHNFGGADFSEQHIESIEGVASSPHFARVSSEHGIAFVRGKKVELIIDESRFAGSGAFLFGSVIERFLGLYTSLNSFSQLVLRSKQRGDKPVHTFPPRAGAKIVI